MEHLEFINRDHFENNYQRKWAEGPLAQYIDFCWQTNFADLWNNYPGGFSDVLFPNIGYTYIINLGTPFTMQLEKRSLTLKNDGFIPRHHYITCHHSVGNQLFGIKFKVCPIVFEKEIDFSEYKEHIYPLAYLIDRGVVNKLRNAGSFNERVNVVFDYYASLITKYAGSLNNVTTVTEIINECIQNKQFNKSIQELSQKYEISDRTLQRYFRETTSFSSKQALQTMRIRQAVIHLTNSPSTFSFISYGYYDSSHFLKHLYQFTGQKYFKVFQECFNKGK
jgi:AraC-like DNA-binding protein